MKNVKYRLVVMRTSDFQKTDIPLNTISMFIYICNIKISHLTFSYLDSILFKKNYRRSCFRHHYSEN